mmetsp:Transcript_17674/g.28602  ORF Transcript_17674/g.28602 Transcript_17674/m.28602 type:complete len:332 (-) Transcript_17674:1120-2115(-)
MGPTWTALCLLLLSVILLLVTWMAATRRMAIDADQNSDMLVHFVGSVLALNGVVLFSVITVVADAVSKSWCTVHGIVIYFFTVLSALGLVGLAVSLWLLVVKGVRDQGSGGVAHKFFPVASGLAIVFTCFVAAFGKFEQETLFCFVYKPPGILLGLFYIPLIILTVIAFVLSSWSGVHILYKEPPSLQKFLHENNIYSKIPVLGNEEYAEAQHELEEAEDEFEGKCTGKGASGRDVPTSIHMPQIKGKVVFMIFVLSCSGMVVLFYEALTFQWKPTEQYFNGTKAKVSDMPSQTQSTAGKAEFYLATCGVFIFCTFALDKSFWKVKHSFSG